MSVSRQILELIGRGDRLLLTTHVRPDGDALGSLSALRRALTRRGKEVLPLLLSEAPRRYRFLFDRQPAVLGQDLSIEQLPHVDCVVILDTSSGAQVEAIQDHLHELGNHLIVIDHHETGDLRFDAAWIDTSAAATGVLVAELLERQEWLDGADVASDLLVAIGSDTGWFRYSNTDGRALRWAGKLAELGADVAG